MIVFADAEMTPRATFTMPVKAYTVLLSPDPFSPLSNVTAPCIGRSTSGHAKSGWSRASKRRHLEGGHEVAGGVRVHGAHTVVLLTIVSCASMTATPSGRINR